MILNHGQSFAATRGGIAPGKRLTFTLRGSYLRAMKAAHDANRIARNPANT